MVCPPCWGEARTRFIMPIKEPPAPHSDWEGSLRQEGGGGRACTCWGVGKGIRAEPSLPAQVDSHRAPGTGRWPWAMGRVCWLTGGLAGEGQKGQRPGLGAAEAACPPHVTPSRLWSHCWGHRPQGWPRDWSLPGEWESGLAGKGIGCPLHPISLFSC